MKDMKYIAILGRQPEFGLVELESLVGAQDMQPFGAQAALLTEEFDINHLGGTQKIGEIIYRGPIRDINEGPIEVATLPVRDGKTTFGLSYYGLRATQKFVAAAGITLKKRLKGRGSVRFVAPQTGTSLGAAQVKFNGLLRNGFELLVVIDRQQMVVAITRQIQDIDWYAARDYGRPTRSAKIGMLPPKLAQIMINTTSLPFVYDPFVGTGVVLQEALLLDRAIEGSDLNPEMVAAAQENLAWLQRQRPELTIGKISQADATEITLPKASLAIVSEGYLGANQSHKIDEPTYLYLRSELTDLYLAGFKRWAVQLEADSEVTITMPVWNTPQGWRGLDLVDQITGLGYTLRQFAHVNSVALIYRRPNQFVGRQLLILRKN
jgi:tRNA G10  N-methylase Trm11